MEIGFIYPEINTESYLNALSGFNSEISLENRKTMFPRLFATLFSAAAYILWGACVWLSFFLITWYVTAKPVDVLYLSAIFYVLGIVISFNAVHWLLKKNRPFLLELFRSHEAEESYSLSAYVERKDGKKLARAEVDYYKMCDILKKSKVTDAVAVCDGDNCRVEVAYNSPYDSGVFTFNLPYHESSSVAKVIVDLSRRCVIFPTEVLK